MAYRVEYGKNPKYSVPYNKRKWARVMLVIGIIIAGAAAGFYAAQVVGLQHLLPGDPVVTGTALDTMVENLRSGLPAGEAFSAFCQEIIAHAQILE